MSRDERGEPRPRGTTLADLLVLVLGASVALGLTWYSDLVPPRTVAGLPSPGWFLALNRAIEAVQKACVALVPLILYRRSRDGSPIRPGEFPIVLAAIPHFFHAVSFWPAFGLYYTDAQNRQLLVHEDAYDRWERSQIAIGAASAVLAVTLRRRLPPWALGLSIAVGYGLLSEWGTHVFRGWLREEVPQAWWSALGPYGSRVVYNGAGVLLQDLPLDAALVELRRTVRPRPGWVERLGIPTTVMLMVLVHARYKIANLPVRWDKFDPFDDALPLAMHLGAVAIGVGIAWRFAPAWRRLLDGPGMRTSA